MRKEKIIIEQRHKPVEAVKFIHEDTEIITKEELLRRKAQLEAAITEINEALALLD